LSRLFILRGQILRAIFRLGRLVLRDVLWSIVTTLANHGELVFPTLPCSLDLYL
jgi:hypothetical protein